MGLGMARALQIGGRSQKSKRADGLRLEERACPAQCVSQTSPRAMLRLQKHKSALRAAAILLHHKYMHSAGKIAALPMVLAMAAVAHPSLQFALHDTEGVQHSQNEWSRARAVVLFFVTTDCPLSNGYAPEMNRIEQTYAARGVAFYAVQGDTTIPDEEVRRHAHEYGYRFPALLDPRQVLARHTGATVTPQAVVLSPEGAVLYLGRIDNKVEDFGKTRVEATEFDLRDALDAVLAGRPVPHPHTRALGCAITNGH
jgi:peroxiredoxin